MNGYDFDKTIFDGDSTAAFCKFCFLRHPNLFLYLPRIGWNFVLWQLKIKTKTEFKEKLYSFFGGIKDIDADLAEFWDKHFCRIKGWYLEQKKEDDLIISASPEFLLAPAMAKLGLRNMIASKVDKKTGKYDGENCWGAEKVNRFTAQMPGAVIEHFYSDSRSDTPMAKLAQKESYLVDGNTLTLWDIE